MTRLSIIKFIRKAGCYGFISLLCFVINNLLLIGLDVLGQPLWVSLLVSASVINFLGFSLQSTFTFSAPLRWSAFCRYNLIMLPNIPMAYALLWLLHEHLSIAMYYSAPLTTALLVIWNAAGSAWALQRRSRSV
jgi:hypothetical protein